MVHKAQILDDKECHIGDLFVNDNGSTYTAIMNETDSEAEVVSWWEKNLYGTCQIVGLAKRRGRQCYLIHTK